jgi:uncharacterized protein (DUF3084 family)
MKLNDLNPFRKPQAHEIAESDLADAKRQLLEAQSKAQYFTKMAEYYQGRIESLTAYAEEQQQSLNPSYEQLQRFMVRP